jgi:hypothetical protein
MKKHWKDMTDEEDYEIYVKGQIIDPIKIEIPKQIDTIPAYDFGVVDDPDVLKAQYEARIDELTQGAKQPKLTIKERAMNALLNQLIAFLKTWLYGRPVYKTFINDKGEIEFVTDDNGKKAMNVPLTILGRAMQVLGALGLLTSAVWGKTVAEWGDVLRNILAILGV